LFTEAEQKEFDSLKAKIDELANTIERQAAADALLRRDTTAQPIGPTGPTFIDSEGRVLRGLAPNERLADLVPQHQRLRDVPSMGAVIRAMATGNWSRVRMPGDQQRAMGVILDQPFPVPEPLANVWLDLLRAQATVFAAGALTLPMSSMTTTIVSLDNDPSFGWRVEHVPLPMSDLLVSPLTMKARTCGGIVPMSVELSEDSPFADDLVQTALLRAAAQEIDRVMLAGSGNQVAPSDEPRGVLNWPGIGSVPATVPPTNYADMLAAYGTVLGTNDVPNAMIGNTALSMTLAGLADTTGQPLNAPEPIASLDKYWTSKLPANTSIVGNFRWLALGLRTGLTLEITRDGGTYTGRGDTGSTFNKLGLLARLYWRGDVAVLRPAS
ncbi:MAG: phage major capsid protein, partial [Solimonas sp.]